MSFASAASVQKCTGLLWGVAGTSNLIGFAVWRVSALKLNQALAVFVLVSAFLSLSVAEFFA